jgi:ATP-binding cassette, subfamily B, multidrug efflux pump
MAAITQNITQVNKAKKSSGFFDLSLLFKIIRLASPYKSLYFLAIFTTIIVAVIGPVRPYLIQLTLDEHVAVGDVPGLVRMTKILIAFLLTQTLIQFANSYINGWIGQSVIRDMRNKVYRHISNMKMRFFDRTPVGTLVTRCVNDIETIADLFAEGVITITGDILQILVITGFMFWIDWKLTLVVLSVLPFLLYASHLFRISVKKSFQDVRTQVAKLNAFVQERITGMHIVQMFNRETRELIKFKEINYKHYDANKRSVLYYSVFFPVIEVITAMSLALLVWYGSRKMLGSGIADFGILTAFILYINMFFRPIRMLADRFNTIQMGMVAAERIFKLIEDNSMKDPEGGSYKTKPNGHLSFENVSFAYNDEDFVIHDLSFELKHGKNLALVGETGSGKSSVINLLCKFYSFQKGNIMIDGISLKEWDTQFLRSQISVVLQDVFLFSGTVMDNILLNRKDLTREQAIATSKKIGAHPFIEALPGGYDYKVMERGNTLSVGQRQLISFVRALVSNPEILILDEATSSVDTETEQIIQNAIAKMMENRTSIVIAHRLSTIEKADKIMLMDKGRVIETGTHKELMNLNGHYRKLQESGNVLK